MEKHNLYHHAYTELEQIVVEIEDDTIQLDSLAEKIKKANELVKVCENKLRSIEKNVEEASL